MKLDWLTEARLAVQAAVATVGTRLSQVRPPSDTEAPRNFAEILPPFGTNPPQRPLTPFGEGDLSGRAIGSDPRDLWYLALPQKLTPTQVRQILRASQGGDIWQQFQLGQLMLDTWPMLRKCDHELREAAAGIRYKAVPYAEEGAEPSEQAKERADLVNRCLRSFDPAPFTDERELTGTIYQLAGGYLMGLSMVELLWGEPRRYPDYGVERRCRATAFVHPRHFTFDTQGRLALFDDVYNRYYFQLAQGVQPADRRKFICAQYYSTSGSTLGVGFMRPLAWYWTSVVFNNEWMARMAQNYGAPFLDVTHKTMDDRQLAALDAAVQQGLANRFVRHPEGTTLVVHGAQSMGSENPQRYLAENADKQCQMLILGQTLTSDVSKQGGSLAQGEVHERIREDRKEGVCWWVAREPLAQFARSVLAVNYGDTDLCPTVEPDFSVPMSPSEQAQYMSTLSMTQLPVLAEEAYRHAGLTMPEEGDKVVIRGQIGLLGSTEQPLDPSPEPESGWGDAMDALAKAGLFDEEQLARLGIGGGGGEGEEEEPEQPGSEEDVRGRLSRLSDAELDELEDKVRAALAAGRMNGEYDAVTAALRGGSKPGHAFRGNQWTKGGVFYHVTKRKNLPGIRQSGLSQRLGTAGLSRSKGAKSDAVGRVHLTKNPLAAAGLAAILREHGHSPAILKVKIPAGTSLKADDRGGAHDYYHEGEIPKEWLSSGSFEPTGNNYKPIARSTFNERTAA